MMKHLSWKLIVALALFIGLLGIPALAQIFTLTLPTDFATMEWAIYAADRNATVSYADGASENFKWITVFSRGQNYRISLMLSEGQWVADNDGWVLMMDAITDGYIESDNELRLTLTPAATPVEEVLAPETYQDICNYPQGFVVIDGMTITSSHPHYEGFTYQFFPSDGTYDVVVREDGEYVEEKALIPALNDVPFRYESQGGVFTLYPDGC